MKYIIFFLLSFSAYSQTFTCKTNNHESFTIESFNFPYHKVIKHKGLVYEFRLEGNSDKFEDYLLISNEKYKMLYSLECTSL